jgi:AraC family transcriptional regulator
MNYKILTNQKYLALNQGRYICERVELPRVGSNICLTTHLETAATDLLHYHETAHLSFVLNGGVIDKRRSSESERISGELMFFRAGEVHQSIYRGFPVRNINIALEPLFFREYEIDESNLPNWWAEKPQAKFSLLKIYKELSTNDEFSDSSIEMLLLDLINRESSYKKTPPVWLKQIVEILHDSWNEEISITDLAEAIGIHPKTISKYFPRYFNCTLGEYRRRLKIEKSLSLIKTSNLSLTEIAYECGFYDQSHFTGIFKELTGFLPKQFKKI